MPLILMIIWPVLPNSQDSDTFVKGIFYYQLEEFNKINLIIKCDIDHSHNF